MYKENICNPKEAGFSLHICPKAYLGLGQMHICLDQRFLLDAKQFPRGNRLIVGISQEIIREK